MSQVLSVLLNFTVSFSCLLEGSSCTYKLIISSKYKSSILILSSNYRGIPMMVFQVFQVFQDFGYNLFSVKSQNINSRNSRNSRNSWNCSDWTPQLIPIQRDSSVDSTAAADSSTGTVTHSEVDLSGTWATNLLLDLLDLLDLWISTGSLGSP